MKKVITKKVFALLLSLAMVFSLAACGAKEAAPETPADTPEVEAPVVEDTPEAADNTGTDEKIVIGAIYRDLTQTWFQKESEAAKATGAELGIEVIVGDAQEDPAVLIDVLDGLINQGIQGLVINTCDQGLSQTIVDKCAEAGIPVIAVDVPLIDAEENYLAPAVILDSYLCGQQTAEWLSNTIEANGGITDPASTGFLVMALETISSCVPRADGQQDFLMEKYPDFPAENIIRIDAGAGSTDDGYNTAAATITAHPEIETWYLLGGNDEAIVGGSRFLEEIGLGESAICVGIDGYLAADEFKKETSPVKASAYLQASTVAEVSVTAMYENLTGGTEIFAEHKADGAEFGVYPFGSIIVTKENYQEVMGADAE